jgi:hypothetical protein
MSGRWTLFVWKGKTGNDDASFVFKSGRGLDEKCLHVLQIEWIVPQQRRGGFIDHGPFLRTRTYSSKLLQTNSPKLKALSTTDKIYGTRSPSHIRCNYKLLRTAISRHDGTFKTQRSTGTKKGLTL